MGGGGAPRSRGVPLVHPLLLSLGLEEPRSSRCRGGVLAGVTIRAQGEAVLLY